MDELVIISGKGGTGKTSITGALAKLFKNKVLVDCDVDAADLHLLLKPEIRITEDFSGGKVASINKDKCIQCNQCIDHCRFEAISEDYTIDPIFCEGCGVCYNLCPNEAINFTACKNGENFTSDTTEGEMIHAKMTVGSENSGKLVTLLRTKAKSLAHKKNNELILIDGSPGIGCPVIASLSSCKQCLIVTEPSLSALHDLKRVHELCKRFNIKSYVCINKYDINKDSSQQIEEFCNDVKMPVISKIPYDLTITRAQLEGKSIIDYPDSKASKEIIRLYTELSQIIKEN